MYCFQCEEAAKNEACTVKGVCGKEEDTAKLQDLLVFVSKGIATVAEKAGLEEDQRIGKFLEEALFVTVTNTNFDNDAIQDYIRQGLQLREEIRKEHADKMPVDLPDAATWYTEDTGEMMQKAPEVGVLATEQEDVRSLRELLIYGLKGIAAYAHHAAVLGKGNPEIGAFMTRALASTLKELSTDEMVNLVLEAGKIATVTMQTLDEANTGAYGNPEISEVNLGTRNNPGILISGHDLKDMEMLLKQTEGTGVDVYTHCEMLPANYYPAFNKYDHFVGNYGNSWWHQNKEFASFNGPILMTTNCITPVQPAYQERFYTTGAAGYPDTRHIEADENGWKDFSPLIEQAKSCQPPEQLETGTITGGFAHDQVMALADKVVEAVKSGAIRKFVVMAGCDGRKKEREYFTEIAENLPEDAVILTAGCAKYRYNKLNLGDIGGIPRVLDAGQCNDSYSLAVIALKLQEVFGLEDINELPISLDIAWYEQKACAVLLALLYLGFKGIRLGPTLPAFLTPNVTQVLVDNFDIKPIGDVQQDVQAIMAE
ncbi:MAG: hydroxylamine reductase [Verrucomicrobiota bacterium]